MFDDLKGKTVVIAGGSGLIGTELIKSFSEAGLKVINLDLRPYTYKNSEYIQIDLTKVKEAKDLLELFSRKDFNVNCWINVFYPKPENSNIKIDEISMGDWKFSIENHLNSYFILSQIACNFMKEKKTLGSIINFSSIYGSLSPFLVAYEGTDKMLSPAYPSVKSGINNFTKYMAVHYGQFGIRLNMISPTGVENNQNLKIKEHYIKRAPLKRMLKACEISGTALFLASLNASSFITGQNIIIDGGYSIC